jgi:hypothetical protein
MQVSRYVCHVMHQLCDEEAIMFRAGWCIVSDDKRMLAE